MTPPDPLLDLIGEWGRLWGVPDLADAVTVQFSPRMRRSLGRCRPATGQVRLAGFLRAAPREVLEEVLCHEVAHVAVHRLRGARARPHGPDWRQLVAEAGFEPRTRARHPSVAAPSVTDAATGPAPAVPAAAAAAPSERPPRYHHRCPVCQTVRVARRRVPAWRCAECLEAGLPGTMVISRVPADGR